MTLQEFTKKFETTDVCLEHLKQVRWNGKPFCPHCASDRKTYRFQDGRRFRCADCTRLFRVITGTIFGDSPIKMLPQWFLAIYLETTHSNRISSVQLAKHIDVTQKTAWFMLQRIRNASGQDDTGMFGGAVEIDETYLGDKEKNKRENKKLKTGRGTVARP